MNVPNTITMVRIVLIPVFGYLWWRGLHGAALTIFMIAAFSDLADGFAARVLDQRSKLGQILDPAADKLMLLTSFVVAAHNAAVPVWLAILVIGRDVVLASGGALFVFVFRGRFGPERWKPSRIGKYSTFSQVLTIFLALLHRVSEIEQLRPFVGALVINCAALTTISGIQYVASGIRALQGDRVAAGGST